MFLTQKLFNMKMKEDETLSEHLSNLGSLRQQLEDDEVTVLLSNIEQITKHNEVLAILLVTQEMGFKDMMVVLIDEDFHLS